MKIDYTKKLGSPPPTKKELELMEKLSLGDYEIYSEKLTLICDEANEIMVKTGVGSMLHSGDLVVGIYTKDGDLVCASCGTYLHIVTGQIPIKLILERFKHLIKEGDIWYLNEARLGGVHNPDQFALEPIYWNGELIAWSAAAFHQGETGGKEPGGMIVTAESRWDEGMKLSPIKIGENYKLRDDLLEMMANQVRAPRMQMIDVRARATAADRIRIRIHELVKERGLDFLKGLFKKMLTLTEESIKKKIRGWSDGIYRHVCFVDTVGVDEGLLRLYVTVYKKGDSMIIDCTGTSPEAGGSYHGYAHTAAAYSSVFLFEYPFHDVPPSAGLFNAVKWNVPDGCFLNAGEDAGMSNAVMIVNTMWIPLAVISAKMMFDSSERHLVGSVSASGDATTDFGGINQYGVPIADIYAVTLNAWGTGARVDMDGIDAGAFQTCPWGKIPDMEDHENEHPHFHLFAGIMKDSCGFGKFRGGTGYATALVLHHSPYFTYNHTSKDSKCVPSGGIFGGYPPCCEPGIMITNTNLYELMRSGTKDLPRDVYELVEKRIIKGDYKITHNVRRAHLLKRGDIWVSTACGGCGYGDVLERDPGIVMQDIKNGSISHWVAKNICHVAYDPELLRVDYEETEKLRQEERENRKKRGKKYEEFEKEWLKKKPPEKALKYYGSWPDAKKIREIIRK